VERLTAPVASIGCQSRGVHAPRRHPPAMNGGARAKSSEIWRSLTSELRLVNRVRRGRGSAVSVAGDIADGIALRLRSVPLDVGEKGRARLRTFDVNGQTNARPNGTLTRLRAAGARGAARSLTVASRIGWGVIAWIAVWRKGSLNDYIGGVAALRRSMSTVTSSCSSVA